jgi:outer membrane protein assembly factor BamB
VLADAAFGPGSASPRTSWQKRVQTPNMRGLAIADLEGDGKKELCVITSRGLAILLNHRCEKLWAQPLPSDPTAITAIGAQRGQTGRLIVGCREGGVYVLDARGKFLAQNNLGSTVVRAARLGGNQVTLATAEGRVVAFRIP